MERQEGKHLFSVVIAMFCRHRSDLMQSFCHFRHHPPVPDISQSENLLTDRTVTSSSGTAAFSAAAPKLWNKLGYARVCRHTLGHYVCRIDT